MSRACAAWVDDVCVLGSGSREFKAIVVTAIKRSIFAQSFIICCFNHGKSSHQHY